MSRPWPAALLAMVLTGTGACGATPAGAGAAVVLIGGARTGAPAPTWSPELDRRFAGDVEAGATWTVVVPDGRPAVAGVLPMRIEDPNDLVRSAALADLRHRAEQLIVSAVADDPEADLLSALDLAARVVEGASGPRSVVVADSLLQTAGALRFQDGDGALLSADPAAVADRLAAAGLLPMLTGIDVVLTDAGDTAVPQDPLPPLARRALVELWTTILERSGARVRLDDTPARGGPTAGLPAVTPVRAPAIVPIDGPVVLTDSAVGFLPDLPVLRDPAQAEAVLAPLIAALVSAPRRVRLTGTTSSAGTPAGRAALSAERAALVRDLLVRGGVDPAGIEVRGLGSDFCFVPDRDGNGRLDPIQAARNRQVVVEPVPG